MNKKFLKKELDLDFYLLSITSALKDYQIAFLVNKQLNINFKKIDDLVIETFSGKENYFSLYHYKNLMEKDFYFIGNKSVDGGILIPEMRETNYFFMLKNFYDKDDINLFIHKMKTIKEVQMIVKIDPKKLKSKENLIF